MTQHALILFALSLKDGFRSTRLQRELFSLESNEARRKAFLMSESKRLTTRELNIAHRELRAAERAGANVLTPIEEAYPRLLRTICDPPLTIFCLGTLRDGPCTAVVGARSAHPKSLERAFQLGQLLAHKGETVISGLALGIDAASHRGVLASTRPSATIAVLGSGCCNFQPKRNHSLALEIVEQGGVVLSEFGVTTDAQRYYFPRRNRIIAGLSRRVIVVEAAKRSGSLITAQFALEQGRDVWAMHDSSTSSPEFEGCRSLLDDGAQLLSHPSDLGLASKTANFTLQQQRIATSKLEVLALPKEENAIAEQIIVELGRQPGSSAVELSAMLGADSRQFSVILALMEVEKVIFQHNGQFRLSETIDSA